MLRVFAFSNLQLEYVTYIHTDKNPINLSNYILALIWVEVNTGNKWLNHFDSFKDYLASTCFTLK